MADRQSEAREAAEYVISRAVGTDGLKAKAEAAKALAMLDLSASLRFHAIMNSYGKVTLDDMNEIMRRAGVND